MFLSIALLLIVSGVRSSCPDTPDGGCAVCGPNLCVGNTDAIFSFPGQPSVPCGTLQNAGYNGLLESDQCSTLPDLIDVCECANPPPPSPSPSAVPASPRPTTEPPTLAPISPTNQPAPPTAPPIPATTPNPTTISTPAPVLSPTPVPVQVTPVQARVPTPAPTTLPPTLIPTPAPTTLPPTPAPTTAPVPLVTSTPIPPPTPSPTFAATQLIVPTPFPVVVPVFTPAPFVAVSEPTANGGGAGMGERGTDKMGTMPYRSSLTMTMAFKRSAADAVSRRIRGVRR